jgi:hypothetical protein
VSAIATSTAQGKHRLALIKSLVVVLKSHNLLLDMMKLLLILLAVYILGIIINYAIELQDMEKFTVLSASIMNNPQTTDPKAEKVKAKWVYAFVSFVAELMWPILLITNIEENSAIALFPRNSN